MRVLDHEPATWFLLEHDGELILDVNCSHSAASYSFTLRLDPAERAAFADGGHDYLTRLAATIQESAPGVLGSSSPYSDRNLTRELGQAVTSAVLAWRGA